MKKSSKPESVLSSVSRIRPRLMSGVLFVIGAVLALSSVKEDHFLSRMHFAGASPSYYYIVWEVMAVAVLFFIAALALFAASLSKKTKK